jgi:hypothetical protein
VFTTKIEYLHASQLASGSSHPRRSSLPRRSATQTCPARQQAVARPSHRATAGDSHPRGDHRMRAYCRAHAPTLAAAPRPALPPIGHRYRDLRPGQAHQRAPGRIGDRDKRRRRPRPHSGTGELLLNRNTVLQNSGTAGTRLSQQAGAAASAGPARPVPPRALPAGRADAPLMRMVVPRRQDRRQRAQRQIAARRAA